jgi:hypothetical protein
LVIIAVDSRYYQYEPVKFLKVFSHLLILADQPPVPMLLGSSLWINFWCSRDRCQQSAWQVPCRAWSGHAWGTGAADKQTGERLLNVVSANTVSENGGISPAGKPGLHKISI